MQGRIPKHEIFQGDTDKNTRFWQVQKGCKSRIMIFLQNFTGYIQENLEKPSVSLPNVVVEPAETPDTRRPKSDTDTRSRASSLQSNTLSAIKGRESRSGSTDPTRKIAYDNSSELRESLQKKIPEKLDVPEKKSRKNTFGSISYTFDTLDSSMTLGQKQGKIFQSLPSCIFSVS